MIVLQKRTSNNARLLLLNVKTFRNIALIVIALILVAIISIGIVYKINLSPVDSSDKTIISVIIPENTNAKEIGKILEEKELIRSSTFFNIYVKIFHVNGFKAGEHPLSKSMSFKEILGELKQNNSYNPDQISITFKEGYNMRQIATTIEKATNNKFDDVIDLANDKDFIDEMIKKYWFIDESIKNDKTYYMLEGYLFPDTYFFKNENVSVREIFIKMLDQMDKVLSEHKEEITKKNLKVRDVLIMASILEKEGKTNDFADIAAVFYNRIDKGMLFQSCATAIYGVKKEFDSLENRRITNDIMQNDNPYNTYLVSGMPAGAICNPGKDAIEAAINPSNAEYLYFLSDNQGKTYFFKTYQEHQQKQNQLAQAGKWN